MKEFLTVRPEVQQFAQMMERTLRKHDTERGKGVAGLDEDFCVGRIEEEFKELMGAWEKYDEEDREEEFDRLRDQLHKEAVDVANFCMMLCLA